MLEVWSPVVDFTGYSVSDRGRVRNDDTGRILAITTNTRGIAQVGMSRGTIQHKRSVSRMVAEEFLPRPDNDAFDTPIQLDGDRYNNQVENLMWRPRWFAHLYRRQFERKIFAFIVPIIEVETEEVFRNSREAVMKYGLLEMHIVESHYNHVPVWPTYQQFRVAEQIDTWSL